jgi:hypothetical protein
VVRQVLFPAGRLMSCLRHCLICLIAAVVLGTWSSSVPLLLVSHRHHLVCRSVLLYLSSSLPPSPHALHRHRPVHLVPITSFPPSPSPCAPCRCHPALRITIALCPSSPLPCSPRCSCPAPLVAVALLPSLQLPCSPCCSHPAPLVAVTLLPLSPMPCSPHPIAPRCRGRSPRHQVLQVLSRKSHKQIQ